MNRRAASRIVILAALLAALALLRLLVGRTLGWPQDELIRELRLVSVASAIAVGICLSVSGVMLQSLLRNALASPYILGLAAGAALGVGVVELDLVPDVAGAWLSAPIAAVLGSCAALLLVYRLSLRRGVIDPMSMLLVGVMISVIASALLMLVQFLLGRDADLLLRWMMGRIAPETPPALVVCGVVVALAGLAAGLLWSSALDAAALSDDEAASVGVNLRTLRLGMFAVAGVLTAVSVLLAGPIGFVGLIAPHLARLLVGPRHAALLAGAAIIGAALLLAADTAVQLIPHATWLPQPRGLLPIGILTSAIGGPVFIYLLRRRQSDWIQ